MTQADTTRVTTREGRFAGNIGMEVAALGGVSREMIHLTVTSTATNRETRYAYPVMKGLIVRDAWKTGSVPAALRTVCLKIVMSKDITSK